MPIDYTDQASGEITFGGYNPSRFSGHLVPLPMAPSPDQFPRLQVWLSSISVTLNGKTEFLRPESPNVLGTSILLDTGSPGSAIPNSMYYQLAEVLEVDPVTNRVACEYMKSDGGLTYSFLGFDGKYADILVPFKQVIQPLGHGLCAFTIGREYDCSRGDVKFSCTTLGEDFLRAAYIYVNYDNSTVSMAQAAYEKPHLYEDGIEQTGSRAQAPLSFRTLA